MSHSHFWLSDVAYIPIDDLPASSKLQPELNEFSAICTDQSNVPVDNIHALDNFWKRYNKVSVTAHHDSSIMLHSYSVEFLHTTVSIKALLDKLAIEHEREALQSENEQLRALLKRYLDGWFTYLVSSRACCCRPSIASSVTPIPAIDL
jgi:hypothetical protein